MDLTISHTHNSDHSSLN